MPVRPRLPASPPPLPFHVMLKPRGPICNLDCAYCFYLRKEALYPGSSFHMTNELLESFTRQYIQSQTTPEVTFAWQGGEPTLMGIDFFRNAVKFQRKYRRPGQKINNSLQTNAIQLTDEWGQFFKTHDFLIGVSLDGPPPLHDVYRIDKGGNPTFDRVLHGIDLLKKHQVEFNILACVNDQTSQHPLEIYRFFRDDIHASFIQFIPIIEKTDSNGSLVTDRSVRANDWGNFLNEIFDEWIRYDVGKVYVQLFDVALAAWAGYRPGLCVHEAICGRALAMEHNGDIYACDHFVDSAHFLGNMISQSLVELINLPEQRQFGRDKKGKLPRQCKKCRMRFICNGGCPKDRLAVTVDGDPGLNVLCQGYLDFFTHIDKSMRRMAELLHENRAPAEIMEQLQANRVSSSKMKPGRKRHKADRA